MNSCLHQIDSLRSGLRHGLTCHHGLPLNSLSPNGFSFNRLSFNSVPLNSLRSNSWLPIGFPLHGLPLKSLQVNSLRLNSLRLDGPLLALLSPVEACFGWRRSDQPGVSPALPGGALWAGQSLHSDQDGVGDQHEAGPAGRVDSSFSAQGLVGQRLVARAEGGHAGGRPPRSGRRRLLALLSGLALAFGLSACGGASPQNSAQERQISVWTLDLAPRFNPFMQRVIDDWQRLHPGYTVRWTDVPWSSVERKLLAAVFARTAPDLVNLNPPFAANLASKGGLRDLSGLLPDGAQATYLPRIWQAGRQGSLQFAIPWYLTTRVTMANQNLLRRAGYSAPPRRWDQVPAYAEAVKRRTGRYALFVTVVPDDSAELLESMVQMGVQLLDGRQRAAFESPAGRRAFAFWSDLYRRGLLPREVVSQGYRRAIELYQAGDLAQVATGPDFLRNLQTNAPGIASHTRAWPPLIGVGPASNVAVMNLVVPRQSTKAAAAVDFALFLTNARNQLAFAEEARVLPSSRQALARLERGLGQAASSPEQALVQEARRLSARTLADARVLVPATPGVKRLQAILYTQLQRAMLGELDSDQALAEAARQWNRYAEARWP